MARARETERRRADEPDDAEADADDHEEDPPYEDDWEGEREDEEQEGDEADEDVSSAEERQPQRRSKRRMSAADAAQAALRHVADLIAKEPTGITSLESSEDGWVIGIEVVEDKHVPSSADVLAIYEAEIDDEDGSLMSYRRTRRYSRGQGDRGGG